MSETRIRGYHAHVYFEASSIGQARALCEAAAARFALKMGRMHEKLVGPHPQWSCQLAMRAEMFGEVIPWLMLHREGLSVLVHPSTGDSYGDHLERSLWLGERLELNKIALRRGD